MIEKYLIDACYSFDLKGRNKADRLKMKKPEKEENADILFKIIVEHVSADVYDLLIERLKNYGVTGLKNPFNPSRRR